MLGEYRFGLLRSRSRRSLEPLLEQLEAESVVLDVDSRTARVYAAVRDALRRDGHPIPENDVWIASLAIQHGLVLLSRDEHFDWVRGLARESW